MSQPRQVLPGQCYLLTRRCTQRQFLLRPDDETNNAFIYCLAYACLRSNVSVVAFMANTNHYHAVVIDNDGLLPTFIECFHKLLAKHQNRHHSRTENFWSSQHTSVVALPDDSDVLRKVVYTLCNPVKDHLVERSDQWPGATSLAATLDGIEVRAHRPTRFFRPDGNMPSEIRLRCTLPSSLWRHGHAEWRNQLRSLIGDAETEAARDRAARGIGVLGVRALRALNPTDRPTSDSPKGPTNPQVASAERAVRKAVLDRLKTFRDLYKAAREAWLKGIHTVFPPGTWWLSRHAPVARAELAAA